MSATHPDFGVANAPVDFQRYFDGRAHEAEALVGVAVLAAALLVRQEVF
nr:hypothetical protein Ade03nite_60880 [Actinoplanes derwentensis]